MMDNHDKITQNTLAEEEKSISGGGFEPYTPRLMATEYVPLGCLSNLLTCSVESKLVAKALGGLSICGRVIGVGVTPPPPPPNLTACVWFRT